MKGKTMEDKALEEKTEKILSNMEEGFEKDFATIVILINDSIRNLCRHICELREDVDELRVDVDKLIENQKGGIK